MDFLKKTFFSSYKRIVGFLILSAFALSIPVTVTLLNQRQDIRQHAAGTAPAMSVSVMDDFFQPDRIFINGGDTILWTVTGNNPHTVTLFGTFDSGALSHGQTYSHTFYDAGSYAIVDQRHPGVMMTITVVSTAPTPTPTPTVTPTTTPAQTPAPTPTTALANPTPTTAPTPTPTTALPTPTPPPGTTAANTPIPTQPCPLKNQGDFDCNNLVNTDDFNLWRGEFLGNFTTKKSALDGVNVNTDGFNAWRAGFLNPALPH